MKIRKLARHIMIGATCMMAVCGCGNTAFGNGNSNAGGGSADHELVGADWRTWGVIDAFGTLSLDGTDTDVCVCLFADRAEIYYDEASQRLLKTVEFPERLSDEEYEKLSITLSDDTGDGNTDLAFVVGTEDTIDRRFCYIYDQNEFVYDAFSAYPNPNNVEQGNVDFTGKYTEPVTGRCNIEISPESEDSYTITVHWADSASEDHIWAITDAAYGESGDELVYTDALYYIRRSDDNGDFEDEDLYSDGSGSFWMTEGGMLGWKSDNSDVDFIDGETLFERIEQ